MEDKELFKDYFQNGLFQIILSILLIVIYKQSSFQVVVLFGFLFMFTYQSVIINKISYTEYMRGKE